MSDDYNFYQEQGVFREENAMSASRFFEMILVISGLLLLLAFLALVVHRMKQTRHIYFPKPHSGSKLK